MVVGIATVAAVGSGLLVCLTAHAAAHGEKTPIDIADEYYGTRFGDLLGWVQGQQPSEASRRQPTPGTLPRPPTDALSKPDPVKNDDKRPSLGRIYVTYTKRNKITGLYYSGRTSMVVDLAGVGYLQAALAVVVRDKNHHLDENVEPDDSTFEAAAVDRFAVGTAVDYGQRYGDVGYWSIRGREQQLIDHHGGARIDTGAPYRTENTLRGVAKDNTLGRRFHEAANKAWGELHHYTGYW